MTTTAATARTAIPSVIRVIRWDAAVAGLRRAFGWRGGCGGIGARGGIGGVP
jgi:hypothetical protein